MQVAEIGQRAAMPFLSGGDQLLGRLFETIRFEIAAGELEMQARRLRLCFDGLLTGCDDHFRIELGVSDPGCEGFRIIGMRGQNIALPNRCRSSDKSRSRCKAGRQGLCWSGRGLGRSLRDRWRRACQRGWRFGGGRGGVNEPLLFRALRGAVRSRLRSSRC